MARVRTPEKTLMIISIIVSVVLAGSFSALCYVKWKATEKVRKEADGLAKKADKLQKKISKLSEKEEERDRLAAEIHEYEKILPDDKEVENLMTMLSELGRKSDCVVQDFSMVASRTGGRASAAAAGGAYKKVKFECSVSSSKTGKGYFCACKFLNLLERYERFIAVDNLTISGGKKGKSDSVMSMDVSAHTYMFIGKKMQAAAAGARGGAGRR